MTVLLYVVLEGKLLVYYLIYTVFELQRTYLHLHCGLYSIGTEYKTADVKCHVVIIKHLPELHHRADFTFSGPLGSLNS